MTKCFGKPYESLYLDTINSHNLKDLLLQNKEKFTNFLSKVGFIVTNKESTYNTYHTSTTIMTLKTTCFKVDFNDNFVKISPLK